MKFFVRAIATGFAFALGSALFRKIAPQIGLDDKKRAENSVAATDAATNPSLH